jgi:hypothetical protein
MHLAGFNVCSWVLQCVVEGAIDPLLTFFSDEAVVLAGIHNTQNNYWNSHNQHLNLEVPSDAVKFGARCVVSARKIA